MMTETHMNDRFTLQLEAAGSIAECGGKAARLAELRKEGFSVPDGFVLTVDGARAFERDPRVEAAIRRELARLGDVAVAVRSSAACEDSEAASFAGLFETILEVRGGDAVIAAVRKCIASATSERVASYSKTRVDIAVFVQRMVNADAAGVAFTADPVTGNRDVVVISAVRGLGERLVSGLASAEEWRVSDKPVRVRDEQVLDAAMVSDIAAIARAVEQKAGAPRDIEWVVEGSRISLVQARPITALPEPVKWDPPVAGGYMRNFRFGEWLGDPVTPLFESWALSGMELRLHEHFRDVTGIPVKHPLHVVVNGWYYYGLDYLPTGFRQVVMMPVMLYKFATRFREFAALIPPLAHLGFHHCVGDYQRRIWPAYQAVVAGTDASLSDLEELSRSANRIIDAAGAVFASIVGVGGYAAKAELPLEQFIRKHAPGSASFLELVRSGDVTSATHGVQSLDWFFPMTEIAKPAEDVRARVIRERDEAEQKIRAALSPGLQKKFDALLKEARFAHHMREDQSAALTHGWPVLRRLVLRIGELLCARSVIEQPEDVFFLNRGELKETRSLAATVAERRRLWQRQRRLAAPLVVGELRGPFKEMETMLDEYLDRRDVKDTDIRGLPASPGRVTGKVRIVRSVEEIGRLRDGEILVAPLTTPAWTPAFLRAAGVITDTGSIASHASVVAREYGIPAVVAVGDATTRFCDGDVVTIDGFRGLIARQLT